MRRISLFSYLIFIILLLSCNRNQHKQHDQIDIIKRYDYIIDIEVWNSFHGDKVRYLLNNRRIERYDSIDARLNIPKPFTLYKISYSQEADREHPNSRLIVPKDTMEAPFSKSQCEKLLDLTLQFFQSVEFNVYDTAVNGIVTKTEVYDDSKASIELSYGGRRVDVTINSIHNPSIATKELHTLLRYIYVQSSEHPSKKWLGE